MITYFKYHCQKCREEYKIVKYMWHVDMYYAGWTLCYCKLSDKIKSSQFHAKLNVKYLTQY